MKQFKKMHMMRLNKDLVYDILALLFFIIIHIDYIYKTNITLASRYLISFICFFIPLVKSKIEISISLLFISALTAITGLLNISIIGNATYFKIGYTIMSFFIGKFFLSNCVTSNSFLISTYINMTMIVFRYILTGSMAKIYAEASGNYVSVYLLISLTIYYVKCEVEKRDLKIIPAVLTFILCAIAGGRGGILASGILLMSILILKVNKIKSKYASYLIKISIIFIMVCCIVIYLPSFINSDIFEKYFGRFDKLGLSDHGRFNIWNQYYTKAKEKLSNILWGAPFEQIQIVVHHQNNLHNSLLNVHAFNGIFVFINVFIIIVKNIKKCVFSKNFVFFVCFLTILFRGFTDQVFWGTMATPIFAFYLFYYDRTKIKFVTKSIRR